MTSPIDGDRTHEPELFERDPVIEAYKKDIDRTLLRRNMLLTPEGALPAAHGAAEVRRAAARGRQASVRRAMTDFKGLLGALVRSKVEFLIVGGAAATAHGSARLTQDLDVVYRRSADNLKGVVHAIATRGCTGRR